MELSLYEVEDNTWGNKFILTDSLESAIHTWYVWVCAQIEEELKLDDYDPEDEPLEVPSEPDSVSLISVDFLVKEGLHVTKKES